MILNASLLLANPAMEHYIRVNEHFPPVEKVRSLVFIFQTPAKFKRFMQTMPLHAGFRDLAVIVAIENFKANKFILRDMYEESVDILVQKFNGIPQLCDYIEDFRLKCSRNYRIEVAKNRIACITFRSVEGLCPDVIKRITSLV
jgi:hypothetical protein